MRPIPKPSSDQLKAIGMKLKGNKPQICQERDTIWDGVKDIHITIPHYPFIGTYRWHLVRDDPSMIPTGKTCDDCKKSSNCLTAINRKRLDTCEDFEAKPDPVKATTPALHRGAKGGREVEHIKQLLYEKIMLYGDHMYLLGKAEYEQHKFATDETLFRTSETTKTQIVELINMLIVKKELKTLKGKEERKQDE
jgi:hypothetical protein